MRRRQTSKKAQQCASTGYEDHAVSANKEAYNYVPLELARQFESLAALRGVSKVARGETASTQSDGGFFETSKRVDGSIERLRNMPIRKADPHGQTWWQRRANFCKRHRAQMLSRQERVVETNGPFKGTPRRRELGMLMWQCSNLSLDELRSMLPLVGQIVRERAAGKK